MTTIYFTNHQKQLVDFLMKYSCIIYVTNCLECELQKLTLSFLNKTIDRKKLKWGFLGHHWLWWPKISKIMNWKSNCESQFIVNSGKSINLKSLFFPFLFVQNIFLQHIAHGIISNVIATNVQQESR